MGLPHIVEQRASPENLSARLTAPCIMSIPRRGGRELRGYCAKYELPAPMEPTLVEKLRQISDLKVGQQFPAWMIGIDGWGPNLSDLCKQAADRIEALEKFQRLQDMIDNYPL